MVLSGSANKSLVRRLHRSGLHALGLSGCDNRLLEATPIDQANLGFVGEISNVNIAFISDLLQRGIVPVIAPIGISEAGASYNVNADTAAASIARALHAAKLLFVTNVP